MRTIEMDSASAAEMPELAAVDAFALHLETACEDFEILQDLITGDIRLGSQGDTYVPPNDVADRKKWFRRQRAVPRIQMALAKSFVFNARRANRILTRNKNLDIERTARKDFIKKVGNLTVIRDVNEHGFDGDGTKPSLHNAAGGWLDETSLAIHGPSEVYMGPANLVDYYNLVARMRDVAGFFAIAEKRSSGLRTSPGLTVGKECRLVPMESGGVVQLYDIYVKNCWCGSRRTIVQCKEAITAMGVVLY